MEFTQRQKEILRQINAGKIYDIGTFVDYFGLSHVVQFDAAQLKQRFEADDLPKNYYFPKQLRVSKANMLREEEYLNKLESNALNPVNYELKRLQLKHTVGIKTEVLGAETYQFNFYDGVSVLSSLGDIFEFLILWQYLKSEMLVLELPQKCPERTLGFFFVPDNRDLPEKTDNIDYGDFSCSDQAYLEEGDYILSEEHLVMYGDYLNKKLSPSPELSLFIQKGFCTAEEQTQRSALRAAWWAIAVSILLAFLPALLSIGKAPEYGDILTTIAEDVEDMESAVQSSRLEEDLLTELDALHQKLDILIDMHKEKPAEEECREEPLSLETEATDPQ